MTTPKYSTETPKYPTEIEPWIWLQEDEDEGWADCGCHLSMDDGAKLNFCTMHAAAEDLLEALVEILQRISGDPSNRRGGRNHERLEAAHALVRRAKGAKQ